MLVIYTVSFILCLVFLDSVYIVDPSGIRDPQGYWSFGRVNTYMNPFNHPLSPNQLPSINFSLQYDYLIEKMSYSNTMPTTTIRNTRTAMSRICMLILRLISTRTFSFLTWVDKGLELRQLWNLFRVANLPYQLS